MPIETQKHVPEGVPHSTTTTKPAAFDGTRGRSWSPDRRTRSRTSSAASSQGRAPTSAVGGVSSRVSSRWAVPSVMSALQTTDREGNTSPFIDCWPTAQENSARSSECSSR